MLISKWSLRTLLCLFSLQLSAQVALEQTIVTASKFVQKQSQVTRTVDVLTDSLLSANRNLSLNQLLSQRAGIQIVGQGQTPGSIQTLYTRGADAAYTLVLIDGVPVNDPSSIDGNFDLNFIDLATVSRIEVLKGGQSTLYGSNAVAGVINIITKQHSNQKISPYASLSYGSFNTFNASIGADGKLGKVNYSINYSRAQSEGFSSASSLDDGPLENDGFARNSLNASMGSSFRNVELGVNARISEYDADIDGGAFTDDADFTSTTRNLQLGSFIEFENEVNNFKVNYMYSDVTRSYLDDSTDVPATAFNKSSYASYGTESQTLDAFNSYRLGSSLNWLAGIELLNQNMEQTYKSVSSFGPFVDTPIEKDVANMTNISLYTSLQLSEERYGTELGFRVNRHSVYNFNTSFTASAFIKMGERQRLLANVGNSFRNPSLYQLFSVYGNADLTPEESINTEIGWEFFGENGEKSFGLSLFNRTINDGLFFASLETAPFGQYINQDIQRAYGLEINGQKNWKKVGVSGNYTFLHGYQYATDNTEIDKTYDILRIPKHALQGSFSYKPTKQLASSFQLEAQSERQDRFFNSATFQSEEVVLPAFVLVHLQASYSFSKHFSTSISVRNLMNTRFTEVYGFNSEPRNWKVGLFYK